LALCKASHNAKNWLFAGTLLAGQRAAAIMSLIQSAKLNGHRKLTLEVDRSNLENAA